MAVAKKPGEPVGSGTGAPDKNQRQEPAHSQGVSGATGVAGHLSVGGCDHGTSSFPSVVSLGTMGGEVHPLRTLYPHGQDDADGRESFGRNPGLLEIGSDER